MSRTIDMSHERALIPEMEGARANIQAMGWVVQPQSWEELQGRLDQLCEGERSLATLYALMAWNLAARFDGHNQALEAQRHD